MHHPLPLSCTFTPGWESGKGGAGKLQSDGSKGTSGLGDTFPTATNMLLVAQMGEKAVEQDVQSSVQRCREDAFQLCQVSVRIATMMASKC